MSPTLKALITAAALVTTAGCSVFYDQVAISGVTETTYDDSLPASMETVFAECAEPLTITGSTDEIDLAGSCVLADMPDTASQTFLSALLINGPVDLGGAVGTTLYSGVEVIDTIPWPMQNCEVELDYRVRLDALKLYDLMAGWRNHGGEPSLWIDFDFETWSDVVDFRVDHTVDCPSWINENTLTGLFNVAIPSGWRQMSLRGLDLDLWITLADGGSDIVADLDLDVDIAEIDTDTYLSNLPGNVDQAVLNALGFDLGNIEDEIEAQLRSALADLPDTMADMLNGELPDGHIVCGVEVDANELVVTSDDAGRLACMRLIRRAL